MWESSRPTGRNKASIVPSWTRVCACAVSNSAAEHGGEQRTSLLSNVLAGQNAGAKGKLRRCFLFLFVHISSLVMDVSIHFKYSCRHVTAVAAVPRHTTQARRSSPHIIVALVWLELNTCLHLYQLKTRPSLRVPFAILHRSVATRNNHSLIPERVSFPIPRPQNAKLGRDHARLVEFCWC